MTVPTPITAGTSIPLKLTKNNFLLRQKQLLPMLSCGLNHLLEEEALKVSIINKEGIIIINSTYHVWRRCDQSVLALISSSLSESVLPCVIGKRTSKEAWEAIKRNYSSRNKSRIMELHHQLHNSTKGAMTMDEYIKDIHSINEEFSTTRQEIDKSVFIFVFLRRLPPEYTSYVTRLIARSKDSSLEDTFAQVRAHEATLNFKQKMQSQSYFPPEANHVSGQDKPHE